MTWMKWKGIHLPPYFHTFLWADPARTCLNPTLLRQDHWKCQQASRPFLKASHSQDELYTVSHGGEVVGNKWPEWNERGSTCHPIFIHFCGLILPGHAWTLPCCVKIIGNARRPADPFSKPRWATVEVAGVMLMLGCCGIALYFGTHVF